MSYAIIKPPFPLRFRELSKAQLKSYYQWFMSVLPGRIQGLETEVRQAAGHPEWRSDCSPDSLRALGEWFAGQVQVRPRTEQEIEEIRANLVFPVEVEGVELTSRTFSIVMDLGMYFSQVVLKSLPGTKWDQPLGTKSFVDYGQPVLTGFGRVPLNPVRIMFTAAYKIARQKPVRLTDLYETWAKMRTPG
jgi:hypothetical protein